MPLLPLLQPPPDYERRVEPFTSTFVQPLLALLGPFPAALEGRSLLDVA